MTDHSSPLTQRVRRLLGTSRFVAQAEPPPTPAAPLAHGPAAPPLTHAPAGSSVTPHNPRRPDTGALFESQITRLSLVLRELHAIDRAREAELHQLRERLAVAEAVARAELVERLTPTIAQLDALIGEAARLLQPQPPLEPPPTATLFERMRAQSVAASDQTRREALVAWASALLDLRTQLGALISE